MDKKQCDLIKEKDGVKWYNFVTNETFPNGTGKKIQCIMKVKKDIAIISKKPITTKDIDKISFDNWIFRTYEEIVRRIYI